MRLSLCWVNTDLLLHHQRLVVLRHTVVYQKKSSTHTYSFFSNSGPLCITVIWGHAGDNAVLTIKVLIFNHWSKPGPLCPRFTEIGNTREKKHQGFKKDFWLQVSQWWLQIREKDFGLLRFPGSKLMMELVTLEEISSQENTKYSDKLETHCQL